MNQMKSVGVVGAGLSALAASFNLITAKVPLNIRIFEKSKGVAGRAATRRAEHFIFDHGANYVSLDGLTAEQLESLDRMLKIVDSNNYRSNIQEPIYILNGDNTITPSQKESQKITFPQGINSLGKLIHDFNTSQNTSYDVHKSQRVTHLEQYRKLDGTPGWKLHSENQELFDSNFVLFSSPAPQTEVIIKNSKFLPEYTFQQAKLCNVLSTSKYHSIISVALGFDSELQSNQPLKFYGLVNQDRNNEVSWLSLEHKKLNHVQPGKSMVIIQMASDWTLQNWDRSDEEIHKAVFQKARDILKLKEEQIASYVNVQRWRYALPKVKVNRQDLKEFEQMGLFFTGDSFSDKGRVGIAIMSGLEIAESISTYAKL